MRDFEKFSFEQFRKDVIDDKNLYDAYKLPYRDSDSTAGYDIYLLQEIELEPGEIKKIPTGIKAFFEKEEVLFLVVRSSMGFKYNIRLCNQIGVIDADYYNNRTNEGHIWIRIQNEGQEKVTLRRGEAVVQGIFLKYLMTQSDQKKNLERKSDY